MQEESKEQGAKDASLESLRTPKSERWKRNAPEYDDRNGFCHSARQVGARAIVYSRYLLLGLPRQRRKIPDVITGYQMQKLPLPLWHHDRSYRVFSLT